MPRGRDAALDRVGGARNLPSHPAHEGRSAPPRDEHRDGDGRRRGEEGHRALGPGRSPAPSGEREGEGSQDHAHGAVSDLVDQGGTVDRRNVHAEALAEVRRPHEPAQRSCEGNDRVDAEARHESLLRRPPGNTRCQGLRERHRAKQFPPAHRPCDIAREVRQGGQREKAWARASQTQADLPPALAPQRPREPQDGRHEEQKGKRLPR